MSFRNILEGITQWIKIHCMCWIMAKLDFLLLKVTFKFFLGLKSPFFDYLITAIFSSTLALFRHGELWSRIWSGSRAWWIWPFNYILTNVGAKSFLRVFFVFLQAVYFLEYTNSSIIRLRVCGLYLKEVDITEQVVLEVVWCTYH